MTSPEPTPAGRSVAVGSVIVLTGNVITKILGVVTVVVIAHHYSVRDFGVYSFAIAFGAFVALFADLGIDSVTTRELAADSDASEGALLGSAIVVKALLIGALLALACGSLPLFDASLRWGALVSAAAVLGNIPGTLALSLTARVRFLGLNIVQFLGAVALLGVTVAALKAEWDPAGVVGLQTVITVVTGAGTAALAYGRFRIRLSYDWRIVRDLVRQIAPLTVILMSGVIYRRVDQLLLGGLHQVRELARYAAAVRVVEALNVVPTAVALVALPVLSRRVRSEGPAPKNGLAVAGYRYLAAVILPLSVVGTVAGGHVMALIYGAPYRSAGLMLAILLWAQFFAFTGLLLSQVLIARRELRDLAWFTAGAAVVNVAINAAAIPVAGGVAAAWASLAAYAFPLVAGALVGRARREYRAVFTASLRPAACAGGMLIVMVLARPHGLALAGMFLALWSVGLLMTGSVRVDEVRFLTSSMRVPRRETST